MSPDNKAILIRVNQELWHRMKVAAAMEDTTLQELMTRVLKKYLEEKKHG